MIQEKPRIHPLDFLPEEGSLMEVRGTHGTRGSHVAQRMMVYPHSECEDFEEWQSWGVMTETGWGEAVSVPAGDVVVYVGKDWDDEGNGCIDLLRKDKLYRLFLHSVDHWSAYLKTKWENPSSKT